MGSFGLGLAHDGRSRCTPADEMLLTSMPGLANVGVGPPTRSRACPSTGHAYVLEDGDPGPKQEPASRPAGAVALGASIYGTAYLGPRGS
jgi:hypothetical protein